MAWIKQIADGINNAFKAIRPLPQIIPALLLICEIENRPGLSAIALATAIIRRLPEAGINTGVNPDGSPNVVLKFIRILSEEIVREFKDNARITCALKPENLTTVGVGANAGGEVTVMSKNIAAVLIEGIVE